MRYDYIPKGTFLSRKEGSFRERNIFHTKGRFYSNFSCSLVVIGNIMPLDVDKSKDMLFYTVFRTFFKLLYRPI